MSFADEKRWLAKTGSGQTQRKTRKVEKERRFGSVGLSQHHLAQLIVSSAGAQQSVDSFIGRCHVSPVV